MSDSGDAVVRARLLASVLGAGVTAVGLLVLLGWVLDDPRLTGFYGSITMKTNTAISLLISGLAVLSFGRVPRLLTSALGALVATIGAATLVQHVSGVDLGIDQALFAEPVGALATSSPNRMGLNAATSLMLAGTSLVLLARGRPSSVRRAQKLAIFGIFFALLAVAGYLYGAAQLYAIARYTGIAFHTALSLIALHVALLATRADTGMIARFVSDGPDGTLLRRLAVPVTGLPLALGYVVLMGLQAELYDSGLGYALVAVALIVVLWLTIWQTARTMGATDRQRHLAERHRDELLLRERRARDEAEHANRLKDQFIATLSHELRTPLNVMLGWTQVLEGSGPPDAQARAASIVARNGRLLARLVEDLLDISRATAGQFEITRTTLSINALAQSALDAIAPVAAAKRIHCTANLEPSDGWIQADADRLQQVLSNLLS